MVHCSTHTVTTSSEICPKKEQVGKTFFLILSLCAVICLKVKNVITSQIFLSSHETCSLGKNIE